MAQQVAQWQELKDSQSLTAFGSANLQTFPVTLSMLEQRTGLSADTLGLTETEVSLDDFKYATLYVAGGSAVAAIASLAFLPPNIGATLCYFFALLPILFLGIGSTAPAVIANAIAGWRNSNSDAAAAAVSAQERRCRHEAAHFCCGYWCGLPVADYQVGSDNVACVEFGVASNNNYSRTEVAALSVTALAGLVAEAKTYGQALGATQDLVALQAVFRHSSEFLAVLCWVQPIARSPFGKALPNVAPGPEKARTCLAEARQASAIRSIPVHNLILYSDFRFLSRFRPYGDWSRHSATIRCHSFHHLLILF